MGKSQMHYARWRKLDTNCYNVYDSIWVSQVALMLKNPPANEGDVGLIPGSGSSPEEENGNPFQYTCLENSMDRGA